MAYEERENSGIAFRETQKRSEKGPDWRGKLRIGRDLLELARTNGGHLELAMWDRQGQKGPFLSVQIKEPFTPRKPADREDAF